MGWFLTGKSKTSRSKRSKRVAKSAASPKPWDPQRTLLALKISGVFALLLAGVIGARYGEKALLGYAEARHGRTITAADVELINAPAWMSDDTRQHLATVVAGRVETDPMDGRSLRIAVMALDENPWVRGVTQVARLEGGTIHVTADYREPVAVVQGRDGYHLVDEFGIVLPGLYYNHQIDRLDLPLVTGVTSAPPREAGQLWPGDDVQAGLKLVRLLAHEDYADQIKSYDVSHRDARGRIRLVLFTGRGMVRWGLPPGEEQTIEPEAATKMTWLSFVDRKRGGIDAGGKVVDIYGPRIAVNQPTVSLDSLRGELTSHR